MQVRRIYCKTLLKNLLKVRWIIWKIFKIFLCVLNFFLEKFNLNLSCVLYTTKNRFSKKSAKITFFSKFSHFFLKSIKNNVSWLNLKFLDLVFRKIFKKVFFRKKVLKTSKFVSKKKIFCWKFLKSTLKNS